MAEDPKKPESWFTKIIKWQKENKEDYNPAYVEKIMAKSEPDSQKSVRQYQWQITFLKSIAKIAFAYNLGQVFDYLIRMGIAIHFPPYF